MLSEHRLVDRLLLVAACAVQLNVDGAERGPTALEVVVREPPAAPPLLGEGTLVRTLRVRVRSGH